MIRQVAHFINTDLRDVSSSRELRLFYASTSLNLFAVSMVRGFVPIYLYFLGFELSMIALFYITHYLFRIVIAIPLAKLINRFGVKHILASSYILNFVKTLMLLSLPEIAWPLLLVAVLDGADHITYFLPQHAGLSKLKSPQQAGRQLSIIEQWARVATGLGPLVGGLIAFQFGIGYALLATASIIMLSIIPLTKTPETIPEAQQTRLSQFKWSKLKPDLVSEFGIAFNQISSQGLWALFLGLYVFTQDTYLGLGIFFAVSFLASIAIARLIGRWTDRGHGRRILRFGILGESLTNLCRPLIATPVLAYGLNMVAKLPEAGANIPHSKGVLVRGDEFPHQRVLYMAVMEMVNYTSKIIVWAVIFLIATAGHDKLSLQVIFIIATVMGLLTLFERYRALD